MSADVSAALSLKMSAEMSTAHNFRDEREREHERHFLMSESYSALLSFGFCSILLYFVVIVALYQKSVRWRLVKDGVFILGLRGLFSNCD